MKRIGGTLIVFVIITTLASCASQQDVTNRSIVVLDKAVEIVPMSVLNFEASRASIVVRLNEGAGKLYSLMICLCDFEAEACSLIDWRQTDLHPSDADFEKLVNQLWLEDHPKSEIRFEEGAYFPEPVGFLKLLAVYYSKVILIK